MSEDITRPKLEGNVAVGPDRSGRRLGFAEFGDPQGRPMFWLHGTPGARRQIPLEARFHAERNGIRLIGIDRPGIGSSTPYAYGQVIDFADDLRTLADTLGIGKMIVIGLSGGGPYTLGAAAAMPDRVVATGVLGGVAPTKGPDAIGGGVMGHVGVPAAPVLEHVGGTLSMVASPVIRLVRPVATSIMALYAALSPEGDRRLLSRPEFRAMFLDDLLNGSRKQLAAPFADVVVFARDWGFRLSDVKQPVRWWHGDADHIVPFAHGQHVVARLPDAELYMLSGESHLGGLGEAEAILTAMTKLWDASES
ncbi:MAG: alpha/beta hydrolase [Actinomycetota bacterium]